MKNAIDSRLVKKNGNGVYLVEVQGKKSVVVVYKNGLLTDWIVQTGPHSFVSYTKHSKATERAVRSLLKKHFSN